MFVSSPKGFFLFAEVVSRLGCDNLDEITRDNMTCNFYASNLKHDMLTVSCQEVLDELNFLYNE